MPKSVKKIEKDAFKGCKKLTLYVKKGSYAHKYAKKYHVKYKYWKQNYQRGITEAQRAKAGQIDSCRI